MEVGPDLDFGPATRIATFGGDHDTAWERSDDKWVAPALTLGTHVSARIEEDDGSTRVLGNYRVVSTFPLRLIKVLEVSRP